MRTPLPLQLDEIPLMVRGVFSANMQEQYESTQKFRKLLSIGQYTPPCSCCTQCCPC